MSTLRKHQLIALRNRLNHMGELRDSRATEGRYADENGPPNNGPWNRKRIRIRNKINARLRG